MKRENAVVVGGGFGGLIAAHVLAKHFKKVTVFEKRPKESHTAQANHLHVLLKKGQIVLESLFPGILEEFSFLGAPAIDWGEDTAWLNPFGWVPRFKTDIITRSMSRNLLEKVLQRKVESLGNVEIHYETVASPLSKEKPDLIVLTTANQTALTDWLQTARAGLSYLKVHAPIGYASCLYEFPRGIGDYRQLYIQHTPTGGAGGVMCPVENGNYVVTLLSRDAFPLPQTHEAFLTYSKRLRSPIFHDILSSGRPLTPISHYVKNYHSRLHHIPRFSGNIVALGDILCSLNPVYGQGMTVAALQVQLLDRLLTEDRDCASFQSASLRLTIGPWDLCSLGDGAGTSLASRLSRQYLFNVLTAAVHDPAVHLRFLEVLHLMKTPRHLFQLKCLAPRRVAHDSTSPISAPSGCDELKPLLH